MSDIKMPEKPKFRSLASTTKEELEFPYVLQGEPKIDPTTKRMLFDDPANIIVGVGNLTLRKQMEYEQIYGEQIETTVNKIMYVYYTIAKISNPGIDNRETPELTVDEYGNIQTPMGPMTGALERNIMESCVFILSAYGRITGVEPSGKYVYEPITPEQIVDILKGGTLLQPFEDGTVPFMEIYEYAGIWNSEDVKVKLQEEGALTDAEDDELKNSA